MATDPLSSLTPGQPIPDAERAALAKANAESSAEAHRLAAEHAARDQAERGHEAPVAQVVAESIREKLEALPPEEPAA